MSKKSSLYQSRRNFIKQAGLGLGAISMAPYAYSQSMAPALPSDEKLGIALVGLGYYATNKLAPALKETKNCHLTGIVTGTPSKIPDYVDQYGIKQKNVYNYESYDQIADNEDIDIVYVVLPNSMHAEYTIRALEAGKHVICEKPMAVSVKECEDMIAAAKAADRKLFIGYRMHYEPHTKQVVKWAKEKPFGNIRFIEAGFGFRAGDPKQWRLKKALAGGGAMMDVGVYVIQGSRYATGEEPIAVTAQEFKTDPIKFAEVDETITWQMEFPSGVIANCTTSYNANVERLFVTAEKGWYQLRPAYGYGPIKGMTHEGPMDFPHTNHQALHMDGIAHSLLTGEPDNNIQGDEGLRDMKIIEAIYQSIRTGKRVLL